MKAAPNSDLGYFLGDYEGMAVDYVGRAFHTFFAQTNCDTTACAALGTPDGATSPQQTYDPMDVFGSLYLPVG
jgi:hypothetical protein